MIIGVPKEIKDKEFRVGIVPAGVKLLTDHGHTVWVEKDGGEGSGIADAEYVSQGAKIIATAKEIFDGAEMIIKVKEPLKSEWPLLRPGQILFTYLHLAPDRALTDALLERKIVGIAYETVEEKDRTLPLLTPMSEVAGRMSVHVGASLLEKAHGGRGVLLGGVPGVPAGDVVVLGGGVVGINAAKMAMGLGAKVTILEKSARRMQWIDDTFGGRITTVMSSPLYIAAAAKRADLLIGAVLVPGASAPKLITREIIKTMKKGSVMVDVAVDQGGCFETTRPTTHSDPTFEVDGVIQYCVANMPGAFPRTSTFALTNVTMPYALAIASKGWKRAAAEDAVLAGGVNLVDGKVVHPAVATSQNRECTSLNTLL